MLSVLSVKADLLTLCYLALSTLPFSASLASQQAVDSKITILSKVTKEQLQNKVLLDARELKTCQTSSVTGAKCLPTNTFHSPQGNLASFYNIAWAFSTAGLKETDDVLIFSDKAQDRAALAGLLFLSGQHKVSYWSGEVTDLQRLLSKAPGKGRGIIRSHIYRGVMRDKYIALPSEIKKLQKMGWRVVGAGKLASEPSSKERKLIINGKQPIKNIAKFAELNAKGHDQLLLSID